MNCDRCGKKLDYRNHFPVRRYKHVYWTAVVGSRLHSLNGSNHMTQEFDLCYGCENELIRFLNGCELKSEDEIIDEPDTIRNELAVNDD